MKVLILADSRGRHLKQELSSILDCDFVVRYYPGVGINDCVSKSHEILLSQAWSQVFCLAGICDVTLKDSDTRLLSLQNYDSTLTTANYLNVLKTAFGTIIGAGPINLKPKCIFAPLTGINLTAYNKREFHPDDIRNQTILNDTISLINSEILLFNTGHGLFTPWTSRIIHRQSRNGYTNHYHKLASDGCHLSPMVVTHWANSLHDAILKNA